MQWLMRILRDDAAYWAALGLAGCVWLVGNALWHGSVLRGGLPDLRVALGALCGLSAVGLWLRQPWGRWAGLALFAALFGLTAWKSLHGLTWLGGLCLVLLPFGARQIWILPLRPAEEDDEEDEDEEGAEEPLRSLVLLLREPRHLEAAILAHLASKAWGTEVEGVEPDQTGDDDGEEEEAEGEEGRGDPDGPEGPKSTIVGHSPHYLCFHGQAAFAIHHLEGPYVDDPEEFARDIPETRTRRAIEEHRAWLSIDLLLWSGEDDGNRQAYRLMARFLAEVADENTLAVLDRAEGWIAVYDPETEAKLRSDDPLDALRTQYYPPVVEIDDNDQALAAGAAEARRRWPEFVAAFENRQPDGEDSFSVKAPFTDGENTEFMWMEVTGIENDVIYGALGNEPVDVRNLRLGAPVRVKVEELNDWMCLVSGELTGGFTIRSLADRLKHRGGEGSPDSL